MHSAAIFIDAGYLEKIVSKRYSGLRVDYSKLPDALKDEGDEILRTYYYNCPPYQSAEPTSDERRRKSGYDRFRQILLRLPRYEVREGKTVKRSETEFGQKGIDTLICVDMVKLVYSGKIDKVILIAGDHDLMPGIEAVKDAMVITKLIYHPESVSNQLYEMCDDRMMIDDELAEKIKRE